MSVRNRLASPWMKVSVAVLVGTTLSCDLSVTNPGPVQDEFLNDPTAYTAVVNGMGQTFATALNRLSLAGAIVTRELHPAGAPGGTFGIGDPQTAIGKLPYLTIQSDFWNSSQVARWVSESGLRRLASVLPAADYLNSDAVVGQAYLWAGYANRLLGEHMCEAVIDGGGVEPYTVFLERADSNFTRALEIAGLKKNVQLANAARAGRASVRAYLGRWPEAVADAKQVPTDFVHLVPYFSISEAQYNRIHFNTANRPYRQSTVWNTVYEAYYRDTKDPRTPWGQDPKYPLGDAGVMDLGRVPWYFELKHSSTDSPINLSSGREMRLIEAEALLVAGDWAGAMQIVNGLRASVGVPAWQANSLTEAWTRLKRERGIELWLEGRRLGDLRRWAANKTPGTLDRLEEGEPAHLALDRDLCFPIPMSERETNPNVPLHP